MVIKVTTLVENSVGENKILQGEHGISFFIEVGDPPRHSILFDTGQSRKFIDNARLLGIDLTAIEKVVISHGHYDHSGGFRAFVETFGNDFELVVGQGFFQPKYAVDGEKLRFLGNDFDKSYLLDKSIRTTCLSQNRTEILPGIFALTNFSRLTPYEKANKRFRLFDGKDYQTDLFNDEIVLVLETKAGLVVLLGCSHPGPVNILKAITEQFEKPLHCILGGTHLIDASEDRLNKTIQYLRNLDVSSLGISHCTGEHARSRLPETGKEIFHNCTGTRLEF